MSSRAARLSARVAIGFGVFLAVAEVVRNWGDWGFWPFWVVDYIAAALLIWGGTRVLRPGERRGAVAVLSGAWGFTCAMFYMSFFSHVATLGEADRGPVEHTRLALIIGIMFAITVAGFVTSIAAALRPASADIAKR
ncbi:MAG: hypothetical protein ACREQF_07485 [Candidatus Binataceae bacterium]